MRTFDPSPAAPLTADERERLAPFVSNLDGPVFCLTGLPEAVKGAAFARYSRSPDSLRRILLDEFISPDGAPLHGATGPGADRAAVLFERVLAQYGDDSVAQLGGAHIAMEGVSNLATKILEWGRIASYLEQSTRYIPMDRRPWRYVIPPEVAAVPALAREYANVLDGVFSTYSELITPMSAHFERLLPDDDTPAAARARAVRARALDAVRGLLPAATKANLGIYASGQAYEGLLIRLLGHQLAEARELGERALVELRTVIPDFLTRVDRPDRGVVTMAYRAERDRDFDAFCAKHAQGTDAPEEPGVRLVEWDPEGETRVVAHAIWAATRGSLADATERARELEPDIRAEALRRYAGERTNRRHRPGRALEATSYTFEIVSDYGAYRDLQRHRLLTLQAQPLSATLGYAVPDEVREAGLEDRYVAAQESARALAASVADELGERVGAYALTLAHRIRFTMTMNAREAMHLIELRSQPQGHTSYRRVAQQMHAAISDAGHTGIAQMMGFVDHSNPAAGRLSAERRQEEHATTV